MASRKGNGKNIGAAQELKSLVDRIVALEIERKLADTEFKSDIEDVYLEADGKGYDKKALKLAVRRRHESPEARAKRHETEAIAELYSAAIGDLSGKPLDDLTRRRIDEEMQRQQQAGTPQPDANSPELPQEATQPAVPPETPEQARDKGKQARKDGVRIVDNPYHSSSPLRAMWDEGWCDEDGSDGMEVPAAWKRAKPDDKKPDDPDKPQGDPPPPSGGDDGPRPTA